LRSSSVAFAGQIGEPIEGALDALAGEARLLEILGEFLALRHLRRVGQHVPVEDVDEDVEDAAVVCHVTH